MFSIKKKKENHKENGLYLYLQPIDDDTARYQVLNKDNLDDKVRNGEVEEGCRLFKLEREIKVEFETLIHLK